MINVARDPLAGHGASSKDAIGYEHVGGRILIVDDDATVRRALCRSLRGDGFMVSEARFAADAWAILNRPQSRPEVMILDLMLPDESGLSFLARLPQPLSVGVVLVSGQGRIPHAVEALRLGATDFLEKPVGLERLRPVLSRALEARRSQLDSAIDDTLANASSSQAPLAGPRVKKSAARRIDATRIGSPSDRAAPGGPLQSILDESERRLLRSTLELCDGNVAATARVLQLDRGNLFRRLRRLGIR